MKKRADISGAVLLRSIDDAIITTDLQLRITSFNRAAEKIYGIRASKAIGHPLPSLISYDYLSDTAEAAAKQLREKGRWKGEVLYKRSDGKNIYLVSSRNYILDDAGNPVGMIAVNKEINDLVKERALRQQYELHTKTLLEHSGQAFFLMDTDFDILIFNKKAYDLVRLFAKSTMRRTRNLMDILPASRAEEVRRRLEEVKQGKKIEYEASYPSGKWLHVSFMPVKDAGGEVVEVCAAIRDITEAKKKEKNDSLRKMRHQKDILHAMVLGQERERDEIGRELHDNVNQILAAINLKLNFLTIGEQAKRDELPEITNYLKLAIEEIRKLSRNLVTPRFTEQSLLQKLDDIVTDFGSELDIVVLSKGFVEDAVPPSAKLTILRVVQEQMNNILKHSGATEAVIKLSSNASGVKLVISDNGKGYDPRKQRKGVGITNIFNRVTALNGKAKIKTAPGEGCNLSVTLPKKFNGII